jgi:hypothetical protein
MERLLSSIVFHLLVLMYRDEGGGELGRYAAALGLGVGVFKL